MVRFERGLFYKVKLASKLELHSDRSYRAFDHVRQETGNYVRRIATGAASFWVYELALAGVLRASTSEARTRLTTLKPDLRKYELEIKRPNEAETNFMRDVLGAIFKAVEPVVRAPDLRSFFRDFISLHSMGKKRSSHEMVPAGFLRTLVVENVHAMRELMIGAMAARQTRTPSDGLVRFLSGNMEFFNATTRLDHTGFARVFDDHGFDAITRYLSLRPDSIKVDRSGGLNWADPKIEISMRKPGDCVAYPQYDLHPHSPLREFGFERLSVTEMLFRIALGLGQSNLLEPKNFQQLTRDRKLLVPPPGTTRDNMERVSEPLRTRSIMTPS